MSAENRAGLLRRAESATERYGGGLIAAVGAISLNAPVVAIGLVAYLVGKWRQPKA